MKITSFSEVLKRLAKQSPEEKLRIAFELNEFVRKIREIHRYSHEGRNSSIEDLWQNFWYNH